jgi:tripartite ATP-independent transporter DctM subunit
MAAPATRVLRAVREDAVGIGVAHKLETIENAVLAVVFLAAVVLPLLEIVLRALLHTGIEGVSTLVRHATLTVGMLGAAVAAREERLLSLAVTPLLTGRHAPLARTLSGAVAAAISVLLAMAALEFVAIERDAGNVLVYGVPVWIALIPLPLGFGLIALRLMWHTGVSAGARLAATALTLTTVVVLNGVLTSPEPAAVPVLILIGIALLLGAPIFAAIGGAALFLLADSGVPAAAVAVNHYGLVVNPSLPAIPMFTLAGYLLAESRAPRRLIVLFHALFGRVRGGAALVSVLACTFFTCFTGASGVTILALGGLVLPLLLGSRYRQRDALGLVTGAGLPGVLLMPALPLILYAIVAQVSLESMFLGGLLPALLMVTIIAAWGVSRERREPDDDRPPFDRPTFDRHGALRAINDAKWELSLPVVAVLALASGYATPVEAAAVTALYAFVITTVIHRDLGIVRDVPRVVAECGLMVGGILLILGVALSFTNYLVDAQIPDSLVAWVTGTIEQRWVFLLALNVMLLAAGCIMDIFTAIVVLAPLVIPLGQAFGVHPVHLGILFLANLELGYLTPPVGMNLFFASYRFDKAIGEVFRAILPLFGALILGVLAITYIPSLSTWLPG